MAHESDTRIRKVVCIDDYREITDLLTYILKVNGFEGLGAKNGPEGLELIASARPDLVLLDLMMPGMDGWTVIQRMKQDEYMKTIPVIIVTCKTDSIDRALAFGLAKVKGYITKPFLNDVLIKNINDVLGVSDKVV